MKNVQTLLVNKSNFSDCVINEQAFDVLKEGEVRLKVDQIGLTSNNITYAVVGKTVGYWKFFPTPGIHNTQNDYGIIPAWGFATVAESKHSEVQVGQRYYGYFPMANYLKVVPVKNSDIGFIDGAAHRTTLPAIYNYYTQTAFDDVYSKEIENLLCLLRPLFTTSFLLDIYFADNHFFESQQIVLTSASSKTALALAYLMKNRKQTTKNNLQIIGLTSAKNKAFVEGSDYYDMVLTYEEYTKIDTGLNSSIVEFSGNHQLQFQIQTHLKDALKENCKVGLVHWQASKGTEKLPNEGTFFFAPSYAKKKMDVWGKADFNHKLSEVWNKFIDSAEGWINIKEKQGLESLKEVYLNMLAGDFDAKDGYIFNL